MFVGNTLRQLTESIYNNQSPTTNYYKLHQLDHKVLWQRSPWLFESKLFVIMMTDVRSSIYICMEFFFFFLVIWINNDRDLIVNDSINAGYPNTFLKGPSTGIEPATFTMSTTKPAYDMWNNYKTKI